MNKNQKPTKIFSQYIELPAQLFEHIDTNDFDIYHERLYAVLINHQDFERKIAAEQNRPPCYEESIDSLAWLCRMSYSTCQRKLADLERFCLLQKISGKDDEDVNEYIVFMPDKIQNVGFRQTNKERVKEIRKNKRDKREATKLARNARRRAKYAANKLHSDKVDRQEYKGFIIFGTVLRPLSDNRSTVLRYHKDYKNRPGTVLRYFSDRRYNSNDLSNSNILAVQNYEKEKIDIVSNVLPNDIPTAHNANALEQQEPKSKAPIVKTEQQENNNTVDSKSFPSPLSDILSSPIDNSACGSESPPLVCANEDEAYSCHMIDERKNNRRPTGSISFADIFGY